SRRVLPDAKGCTAGQSAERLLRVGDRAAPSGGADPRQRRADRLRRGLQAGEDQPVGRVDRRGYAELHRRARRAGESSCLRGLSVDRLRSVHGQARRGRRPAQRALARTRQDRMRVARLVTPLAPKLVLTAHGSADPRSAANARAVAGLVTRMRPGLDVRLAFCELNAPSLVEVLDDVSGSRGAAKAPKAVVTPLLLANAYHARVDIPRQIAACANPERVWQAPVLGEDDRLVTV